MTEPPATPEPTGGWREPWPRVFEIAGMLPGDRWALVGGLMVQAHAMAARVETSRVTLDVDAAVRVEARAYSYAMAAGMLRNLGYIADTSTRLAYRFTRGVDVVDLMVADHQQPPPRHGRKDVMSITGGRQALSRLQLLPFQLGATVVRLPVPTLHGALVLKAAAYTVDSRDRDRHLLDAVALLACIVDTESIIRDLHGSDRKRLIGIVRAFDESTLVTAQAPADTFRLAQRTVEELRAALT